MMGRSMVEKHQDTVDTTLKTGNDRGDERKQISMLAVFPVGRIPKWKLQYQIEWKLS